MSYLLVLLLFLVNFTPTGPLFIPINSQRNVTCHLEGNKAIGIWGIILNDGTLLVFAPAQDATIPGITGIYVNGATIYIINNSKHNRDISDRIELLHRCESCPSSKYYKRDYLW